MSDLEVASPNRAERRKRDSNRGYYEIKPLRYSVRDVTTMLRCTRPFVWSLIHAGKLKAQGSRRKIWITASSVEEYFNSLPDWEPGRSSTQR
jgi:hypothetical protein